MLSTSQRKKVAFIAQPEYYRFTYENDLDELFDVMEFKFTHAMASEQFTALLDYNADFNIFFRGEFVPNDVLQRLSGITINLSSEPFPREINNHIEYTRDSLRRYNSFRMVRTKSFDYIFHYDAASLDFMQKEGLILSGEFVFPVATGVYKPSNEEEKWDIFFIGRSTTHREQFFSSLKHNFNFLHIAHGFWGEELVKYINASRICLNVHAEDEISWEPRLQMMLACGAFVISEPVTPNNYLRPGLDYIEVSSKDELFETASYYLEHEEERRKIAESGLIRVQEYLSSKKVFSNLIQDIDGDRYPKFKAETGSLFWKIYSILWELWHFIKDDTNKNGKAVG
ncbi:glycosyltransferase [Patescibacteria group bacterium]|nr:glycosyltransferase [Patescibacteria group bacterium]